MQTAETQSENSARILVVDDAPQIRRALRTLLIAQGYEVVTAATGEAALEALRAESWDLVLLDLGLPGLSGGEVCHEIRRFSALPILVLSVRSAEKEKVAALDAGADDYVTKPFSGEELLARVRSLMRRARSGEPSGPLRAGELELDPSTRRLRRAGVEIRLTPKEFDLLWLLMRNSGKVLTHRKLLQAVWGPDYGEETEVLRVFVNQLRRKIEADPAHPAHLLTEHWVGYRLMP